MGEAGCIQHRGAEFPAAALRATRCHCGDENTPWVVIGGLLLLTAANNQRITETGPGTPCGNMMRRYWQPAGLAEELDGPRPVKRVRLLGEDLVLFREPFGRVGLLHRHCGIAARISRSDGARMADCAARSMAGCTTRAARAWNSRRNQRAARSTRRCGSRLIRASKRAGIIWAYLGPGEPPPLPGFDCLAAPDSHVFAFKGMWSCNWLQALEIGIDPAHASFLHRFFEDEAISDAGYGRQFRAATIGAVIPMSRLLREAPIPGWNRGNAVWATHHHAASAER